MNEAETRADYIDPALKAAGWGVVAGSRIRREYHITLGRIEGHGKRGKPAIADYVLEYRNTKLAVVEAKAWDEEVSAGVGQAKDYAGKLAVRFTYSSNGQGIYGIDMETGKEDDVPSFPTQDEQRNRTFSRNKMIGVIVLRKFIAFQDQRWFASKPLLSGHRRRTGNDSHCREPAAYFAYAGHGHRQDVHCLSNRLEIISQPMELEPSTVTSPSHFIFG